MIQNAYARGGTVYVEDQKGRVLFARNGDLHGFTQSSVTVRQGAVLQTFDEKGLLVRSVSA